MWAIGVCVFQMFVGYTPFYNQKKERIFEAIKSCDYEYDKHEWSYFSLEARDFIEKLLEPDLKKRMTAA